MLKVEQIINYDERNKNVLFLRHLVDLNSLLYSTLNFINSLSISKSNFIGIILIYAAEIGKLYFILKFGISE